MLRHGALLHGEHVGGVPHDNRNKQVGLEDWGVRKGMGTSHAVSTTFSVPSEAGRRALTSPHGTSTTLTENRKEANVSRPSNLAASSTRRGGKALGDDVLLGLLAVDNRRRRRRSVIITITITISITIITTIIINIICEALVHQLQPFGLTFCCCCCCSLFYMHETKGLRRQPKRKSLRAPASGSRVGCSS